jgi:hypothetical protein
MQFLKIYSLERRQHSTIVADVQLTVCGSSALELLGVVLARALTRETVSPS